MFREMRRHAQRLPDEEAERILRAGSSGVLAVSGDNGYPYAVPLSYVYDSGKIYFHCAAEGHKADAIRRDSRVSFCVTAQDSVVPEKFTTEFASVIVFGKAGFITDDREKRDALMKLAEKYSPGIPGAGEEIRGSWDHVCVVCIAVEHMTGKEAVELSRKRKNPQV